ncbi:FAD-dependent oxidoreductase [Microbulbifer sp. VAAF005]|uniref:NAD(P)/FAD-dependent oxidoreductase n=1 Tax=Microbulbifer sp. VAAF005 TaxID=3034230 RepID=UPI0024AD7FA3|nr:FAD-dependent oxidoreductase [Microbulbifer sp. VAAF005]WHI46263.1 FAD-dependent oxidoreductase [Microbulbifer sp. VAAF005]
MIKRTDVLIVGGGFAGVSVAQKLAKQGMQVVLVDRKDHFEVTFATLRNAIAPSLLTANPRKYYRDFIQSDFVQADVVSMDDRIAKSSNGLEIHFKQAVIATGSRYPTLPIAKSTSAYTISEREQEMRNEQKILAKSQSVLIVGGGTVGVELAGEISSAFPNKTVTLVHSKDVLLGHLKPKAQNKALEQLTAKGVSVHLNTRLVKEGAIYRSMNTQETFKADLIYECVGMSPNTGFLKTELPGVLDKMGLIKVDEYMRVRGYSNLYAIGDCSTLDENKHGYLANVQGGILASVIINQAKGKKVKPYKTPSYAIVTPTGTETGVAQMPFGVFTSKLFVNLKQKDMGIGHMLKASGTTPDLLS